MAAASSASFLRISALSPLIPTKIRVTRNEKVKQQIHKNRKEKKSFKNSPKYQNQIRKPSPATAPKT
jgi:hypothetical protein